MVLARDHSTYKFSGSPSFLPSYPGWALVFDIVTKLSGACIAGDVVVIVLVKDKVVLRCSKSSGEEIVLDMTLLAALCKTSCWPSPPTYICSLLVSTIAIIGPSESSQTDSEQSTGGPLSIPSYSRIGPYFSRWQTHQPVWQGGYIPVRYISTNYAKKDYTRYAPQ